MDWSESTLEIAERSLFNELSRQAMGDGSLANFRRRIVLACLAAVHQEEAMKVAFAQGRDQGRREAHTQETAK